MIQLGRAEDIGSGIRNVTMYLPHYAKGATVDFVDGELFKTVINFTEAEETKDIKTEKEVGLKVGLKLSDNELKILNLIHENKYITIVGLANSIGISEKSIYKNLDKLKLKGILKRIGSKKTGHWKLIMHHLQK